MRIKPLAFTFFALTLLGCEKQQATPAPADSSSQNAATEQSVVVAEEVVSVAPIDAALEAQSDASKARYPFRNPKETLTFFEVKPGMTVIEALPGGGWYTKILLPLLGEQGTLIGADYPLDLWPKFGFFNEQQLEEKQSWTTDWPKKVATWGLENSAQVKAFNFAAMPSELAGSVDTVLFIRALHNLARFNPDGDFLDTSLAEAYTALKPGGILGIVQHEAREDTPEDAAKGDKGYIKKSFVIAKAQDAGFELIAESDINENPNDTPSETDIVWRLPPSLNTSKEDPELRAKMQAIGESHRMTLKFKKPEADPS